MFGLGTQEILLILLLVLILFGAKKIPEIMRGLGQGIASSSTPRRRPWTKSRA